MQEVVGWLQHHVVDHHVLLMMKLKMVQHDTSTTSQSCTNSWTNSLSYTIDASLSFFGFGESQSETVSNTVSSSYSHHTSKSCGATCGNGTTGTWTLFQWIMGVGEYAGADIVPVTIYTCEYECSTITTPPKCPPTYCA